MPALPQNATSRVFVDYVTGTGSSAVAHTLAVRLGAGGTATDGQTAVLDLLNAIGAGVFVLGWQVTGVRFQAQGDNLSFVVPTLPALASFGGTSGGFFEPWREAMEVRFVGRGAQSGRRVSLSLYGLRVSPPDNYRLTVASPGAEWVGPAVASLNAATSPIVTIGGDTAQWYAYASVNFNSYWERALRTS